MLVDIFASLSPSIWQNTLQAKEENQCCAWTVLLFVKDKSVRNQIYWKCQNFVKCRECRAITVHDELISVFREHNRAGDPVDVEVRRFMQKIKK